MTRLALALALLAPAPVLAERAITVLGDSVLAWHEESGQSIAQVLAAETGSAVENLAVPGARFSANGLLARLAGLDIRHQYPEDQPPGIVVLDGGGNDLGDECNCDACYDVLDDLIGAGGTTGEIPEFVAALAGRGETVIWLAYYPVPLAGGEFAACSDEFDILKDRLARLADSTPAMTLVDPGPVWDRADLGLYDPDLVHPSVAGAARLGQLLAETVEALE